MAQQAGGGPGSQSGGKFQVQLTLLSKSFPDWDTQEIARALQEVDGDVEQVQVKKLAGDYDFTTRVKKVVLPDMFPSLSLSLSLSLSPSFCVGVWVGVYV